MVIYGWLPMQMEYINMRYLGRGGKIMPIKEIKLGRFLIIKLLVSSRIAVQSYGSLLRGEVFADIIRIRILLLHTIVIEVYLMMLFIK